MKAIYKILLLVCILFITEISFAQKRLRMQVTNNNTNKSTDCDGAINDSDFEWRWFNGGTDLGCAYYGGNNGAINDNSVRDLYDGTYASADCWTNGMGISGGSALTLTMRGTENDQLTGSCNESSYCTRTDGTTVPVYSAAIGTTTFANNTGVDCNNNCDAPYGGAANLRYNHTVRWNVEGSFSANNLNGTGFVNNSTCATARNLGSGSGFGAAGSYALQCLTTWYYYDLSANSNTFRVDPSENGTTVNIYYSATSSCGDLCWRASGGGEATVTGALAGRYYFSFTSTSSSTYSNIAISRTATSNDMIQYATAVTPSWSGSRNNTGLSEQGSEPNPPGDMFATWWYTFTTPAGGLPYVEASISEGSGADNSAVAIYRDNGANCTGIGQNLTHLSSDRWCASSGGSVSTTCLAGNTKYYVQYGTASNFALCIGGENTGNYNVSINAGAASGKDDVCSAHDFGTLSAGANTGYVYYNNNCMGTQPGEQRLSDMSNTMWYKFKTPLTTGLVNAQIDVDEDGEGANLTAVTVYLKSGACSGTTGLTEVGFERWCASDGGTLTVDCLIPNSEYYIQLGTGNHFSLCTNLLNGSRSTGKYRLRVRTNSVLPGPNDICAAVSLGTSSMNTTIQSGTGTGNNNFCANATGEGSYSPSFGKEQTVWYSFSTGATVGDNIKVEVRTDPAGYGDEIASELAVFSRATCSSGVVTLIAEDNPVPFFGNGTEVNFCPEINTNYWVMVDHDPFFTGAGEGYFDVRVTQSNYNKASSTVCGAPRVGVADILKNTTITSATFSNKCSNPNYFYFTTPPAGTTMAGRYFFSFNDIDFSLTAGLVGEVYRLNGGTLCASPSLGSIGTWDPAACGVVAESDGFCLLPSSTYVVKVSEETSFPCGGRGRYQLKVRGSDYTYSPDNLCDVGTSLGTLNYNATITKNNFSNYCATVQAGEPGGKDETVWYNFTTSATPGTRIDVDVDASDGEGGVCVLGVTTAGWVRIYEQTAAVCPTNFANLTEIGTNNDITGVTQDARHIECVKPSTTYWVQVETGGLSTCGRARFNMSIVDNGITAPANDKPCGATVTTVQAFNTYATTLLSNQTNVNATNCFEPDPSWTSNGNDRGVWYKFNSLPGRRLVIDANNTGADDIDIQLAIYEGNPSCNNLVYKQRDWFLSPLFCVDGLCDEDFIVTECLDPSKEYYVMVDGGSALGINSAMHQGTFSTRFYFPREGGLNPCLYNAATNPYGAPRVGVGAIPTGGSAQLLNNSNYCGLSNADLTAQSIPLPAWGADDAVFFVFRPPASGSVKITATSDPVIGPALGFLAGDAIDLQLAVYEASGAAGSCTPPSWSIKASASNSIVLTGYDEYVVANCLDPAKDYYLLVDGTGLNTVGFFDLLIEDYGITTPNDLQCNAIDIVEAQTLALKNQWRSCNQNLTLTLNNQNNYCADNINEPVASNWPGTSKVVWYKFDAPPSGGVHFELNTVTSNPFAPEYINAKLAVYDLPDGEDLCTYLFLNSDEIASDYTVDVPPVSTGEDMNNVNPLFPDNRFVYCLTPGRTYYLAVDGEAVPLTADWDKGEFSISIESSDRDAEAPNDEVCDAKFLGNLTLSTLGTTVTTVPPPARKAGDPTYCMRAENNFCADNLINGVAYPTSPGGLLGTSFDVDQAVWYRFIAPWTTAVEIRALNDPGSLGDQIDLQIGVFESSNDACGGTFSQIKGEYDPGFFSETVQVNCLEPGKPYWVMVDGSGLNMQGYFELEIEVVVPTELAPVNDDLCDAISVNPFAGVVNRANDKNRCATLEATVPNPSTFDKDYTVWYKFITPAGPGPYAVRVDVTSSLPWPFGDAIFPQIAVYKSDNNLCSGTITEHFSDYSVLGWPFTETADVHCLEPNTRYFVMVDGAQLNNQGFYDISFQTIAPNPIAVNNDRCNVVSAPTGDLGTLGAPNGSTLGGLGGGDPLWNNFCSDTEAGEPDPAAFGLDQTVWFKFRTPIIAGPNDGVSVNFYLDNDFGYGDQIDLQFAVYQAAGGCASAFTEIESSYNPLTPLLNFFDEEMDLCLKENTEYWIQVDGSALNTQGYFKIRIRNDGSTLRPANDDFCNASSIILGTPLTNQSNVCATIEVGEPKAGLDIQKSVWYKFTAPASGRVEIRTQDADGAISGIDPEWKLYEFTGSCSGGTFTGSFDELASAYFPTIGITNPDDVDQYECLFPGRVYYIQVDGTTIGGAEGIFNISVTNIGVSVPANNACAGAIALSVNTESCEYSSGTWSNRNYGTATRTLDNVSGCGDNCGDTWYSFVMPTTGFAKIEGDDEFGTFGVNNSELVISAFRGTCGSLTHIQCDNGGSGKDPDYSIAGTSGETIYLQVYSANGNSDDNKNIAICVSERCSADECSDAVLVDLGVAYCWDIRDATTEPITSGYPVCGAPSAPDKTVYFRFETDAFCWGYQIIITTPELSATNNCLVGNSPTSELVMSVYQVDPLSLCDGNVIAVLDCETFNDCDYPSGVNTTITYMVGAAVNNIKANSTYMIQLDARDQLPFVTSDDIVDGTITVRKLCDGREWQYAPLGTTASNGFCEDATGWRHYYYDSGTPADPSDDYLIYSVFPNGNTFDGTASITLANAPWSAVNATAGSWVMRRYWDFNMTSGSINPAFPVNVRFYYNTSEKNEIITLAQNYALANALNYEPFEWFKSKNGTAYVPNPGAFAPIFNITPEYVLAQYGSGVATLAPNALTAIDHDADPTNEWCNGVQYVDIEGLIGFSGGTGATGAGTQPSPLPVELVEFTGYHDDQDFVNILNWKTASELNNDYFVVQRSIDGVNFINIGEVEGNGTSNEESNYSFIDNNPAIGKNYYRLRQVDFDGTSDFSDVISIDVKGIVAETKVVNYYPNPTMGKLYIEMQVANDGNYDLSVIDVTGKVVYNGRVSVIKSNKYIVELDASSFAQGAYIVRMVERNTGEILQFKFIKQ